MHGWLPETQQCQCHYFQFDQRIFQSYGKLVRGILHTEYTNYLEPFPVRVESTSGQKLPQHFADTSLIRMILGSLCIAYS